MTQIRGDGTRDRGVALAIEAAGGVGALARKLGISQPSISGWTRIPADRVCAVEAATGVDRSQLRPDLYNTAGQSLEPDTGSSFEVDPISVARAQQYRMLAALLLRPPQQAILDQIGEVRGDVTPLGLAHIALAKAARDTNQASAGAEYFKLFIGVGRGELLPYASYYLTGFLNERPLARVRQDLGRYGVERAAGVFEPEDHVGTLFEVLAGLIDGSIPGGEAEADQFFARHLKPWALRFFADLAMAESADFYRAVAETGRVWLELETAALELEPPKPKKTVARQGGTAA